MDELKLELSYQSNDEQTNNILEEYWSCDYGDYPNIRFTYKVLAIAQKYNKKEPEISQIAKAESNCKVVCILCGDVLFETSTRSSAQKFVFDNSGKCSHCSQVNIELKNIQENALLNLEYLQKSFKTVSLNEWEWRILNKQQKKILYAIAKNDFLTAGFYSQVFPSIPFDSPEGKTIWGVINSLALEGYFSIIRIKGSRKIEVFEMDSMLKKAIISYEEACPNSIKLTLCPNIDSTKNFTATTSFDKDIHLCAGDNYKITFIFNDDGTASLHILPEPDDEYDFFPDNDCPF